MTTPRIQFRGSSPRSGITLIELLVVIGILLLLLVTVAPNLAPTPEQKGREAAATVISMINRAQKRAVDEKADAGLWLEPLLSSTSGSVRIVPPRAFVQLDGATVSMASLDMFASEPQDPYNGDDPDTARAFIYPVNSSGYVFVPGFRNDECLVLFEDRSCAFIRDLCSQSSRITVDSRGYDFRLLSDADQRTLSTRSLGYFPKPYRPCNLAPGGGDLSSTDPQFQDPADATKKFYPGYVNPSAPGPGKLIVGWIRSDNGDSPVASGGPWTPPYDPASPVFPVSSPYSSQFAIQRPNTRTATPPLSIPAGFAIDVAWSSYGTLLLHNSVDSNRLGNGSNMQLIDNFLANQPVQVMFDMNSRLKNLVVRKFAAGFGVGPGSVVDQTLAFNVDLFLLVGRADRVGRPYVPNPTEVNPGANWQYPDSRWIKISSVTGKTLIADSYLGVDNVYDSQAYARSDIAAVRN
jgi:type II secretory pathway pseudopilin PulG